MAAGAMAGAGIIMSMIGDIKAGNEAKRVANILRNLPEYKPVDITGEQSATIKGNEAALPGAESLASSVNDFNSKQLLDQIRKSVPNLDAITKTTGNNILSMLKGELTQGESDYLTRRAAERNLVGGVSGTGFGEGLRLRSEVTGSMARTMAGIDSAMKWLGTVKSTLTPDLMSPTSSFLTPQQRIAAEMENRKMQYQSDMNVALGKTAPGMDAMYAQILQQRGAQMMSMGMGGMGGGIGGGSSSASSIPGGSSSQQGQMMQFGG